MNQNPKSRWIVSVAAACLASAAFAQAQVAGPKLDITAKAPALQVAKWVKGKETKEFAKGNVYVVEFWATWCGPCKTSIPHLTDLAKQYKGKVNFIGVSVWENKDPEDASYFPKVDAFVKEMGDKMDYAVAVDDPTGKMANTWLAAAGEDGIPSAFVVDQTGTIAWIGHPMSDEFETVLKEVVAGTFDKKAAAEARMKARAEASKGNAEQEEMMEAVKPINDAAATGDPKKIVAAMDEVMKKHPKYAPLIAASKFKLLLSFNETEAYSYGEELSNGLYKADPMRLNEIAWSIVDPEAKLKSPNYKIAAVIADKAVALCKSDDTQKAYTLDTAALAHFKMGDAKTALKLQQQAVDILAKQPKDEVEPETVKELQTRLEQYKAAAK